MQFLSNVLYRNIVIIAYLILTFIISFRIVKTRKINKFYIVPIFLGITVGPLLLLWAAFIAAYAFGIYLQR